MLVQRGICNLFGLLPILLLFPVVCHCRFLHIFSAHSIYVLTTLLCNLTAWNTVVLHRDRIVKPTTQRVVRGYWWEPINGGRLCGDGVPTLLSGVEIAAAFPGFSSTLLKLHGAMNRDPSLGRGRVVPTNHQLFNTLILSFDLPAINGRLNARPVGSRIACGDWV